VPPGWQLWVSDPPRRKTGLIIAAALAATLLVVVGVVVAIAMTRDTPQVTVTPPTTTNELSDEQQIEDVVSRFQDAWNDEDFSGFEPIVCQEMREAEEFNESDFLEARQESDEMDISVTSVDVDGDSATASVKGSGGSRDIPFLREADGWKWCDP